MKKLLISIVISFVFVTNVFGWTATQLKTDLGIQIQMYQETALQYESYWGEQFENIQWDKVDVFFTALANAYGVLANPADLRIEILPFDENWVDNETPVNSDGTVGREIVTFHYDGIYVIGLISIHLGDDKGKGGNAFCQTALDYELGHHFLLLKGDPCWFLETYPGCPEKYISAASIGLCN